MFCSISLPNVGKQAYMAFCHGRTGVCPTQGDCGWENPSLSRAAKGQALVADIGPGCLCGQSLREADGMGPFCKCSVQRKSGTELKEGVGYTC